MTGLPSAWRPASSSKGDKNFRTRCEALNAAVLQSEEALEEMKKRKGRGSDLTPASPGTC